MLTIGAISGVDGGIVPPKNLAWWDIVAFIPPKICSYWKTLCRSRFCKQPTEMFSKDVQECDRELLYFYTVKIMCVYFPTQCFLIAGLI